MEEEGIRVEWCPKMAFREEDKQRFYLRDTPHIEPPMTPMGASVFFTYALFAFPLGVEELQFPYSRGLATVLYNGRMYTTGHPITDVEEIRKREPKFMENLSYMVGNWPKVYGEWVDEWRKNLEHLAGVDREKLSLKELYDVLRETIRIYTRNWVTHAMGLYVTQVVYIQFEEFCRQYGIDEKTMLKFLLGYPTKQYEIDRELWRLADLAMELRVSDTFMKVEKMEQLPDELSKSDKGRRWLEEFNKGFLQPYGRRTTTYMHDYYYSTWLEDPSPALFNIKTYIMQGTFDFDARTRELAEERERLTWETLAKMKTDEERQKFQEALWAAQATYPFTEDHSFYIEGCTGAEVRYSILECGRRLCEYGLLEEPGDVFFLEITELYEILEGLILNDKAEVIAEKWHYPPLVKERKEFWKKLHAVDCPAFIGTVPEERIEDPLIIKIYGLTDEAVRGVAKPPEAGLVEGFPGAAGITEGYARVISSYEGLNEVMPGDILVTPFTTPAWTPVFSKIKAVVTDAGGMLSHAAICARDYGIPAVIGTTSRGAKATDVIKTGQKIRVDGNNGVVEVLSGSA